MEYSTVPAAGSSADAVIVDPEFRSLIPPLADEERAQLEANLVHDGCLDPLKVWRTDEGKVLLDGHHRHDICTKHGLAYDTREVDLEDRDAAKAWAIENQFGRRNLTAFVRGELALKLKPLLTAKAKESQGKRTDLSTTLSEGEAADTRRDLAERAQVSEGSLSKVQYLDANANEETKEKLRAGEVSIHAAYTELRDAEDPSPALQLVGRGAAKRSTDKASKVRLGRPGKDRLLTTSAASSKRLGRVAWGIAGELSKRFTKRDDPAHSDLLLLIKSWGRLSLDRREALKECLDGVIERASGIRATLPELGESE